MLGNLVSGSRDMGYLTPVRSPWAVGGDGFPLGFFVGNAPEKTTLKMSMAPVGLDAFVSFLSFLFHHIFFCYFQSKLDKP